MRAAPPPARELEILNAIAQALNGSLELEEALGVALGRVAELLGLRAGWVFLLDEETGEPALAAAQSLPPGLADDPGGMEGSCYCLDTFRGGGLGGAANVNVVTCSRLRQVVDGAGGLRCHATIPLRARGKPMGVMNVASPEWRRLTADELRILGTVGEMLGLAVERARLFARSARAGAAEERNRIAREIHDTLAQGLAGITLQLETAEALMEAGAGRERVGRAVSRALALARESLEDARRSVLDLRAAPLEGRSLGQALKALATETSSDALAVRFSASPGEGPGSADDDGEAGEVPRLPSRVEAALYRIAREALANVARHAEAGAVSVRLAVRGDHVELAVEDDGRGFEPGGVPAGRYGLVGIGERARLLGGTLRVESAPGMGTRLVVEVPRGGMDALRAGIGPGG